MAPHLHFAALIGFAALMAAAAVEDFRRLTIPNEVTIGLCALWPLYITAEPSLSAGVGGVGCALAVFLAGALCFSRGYLGGGDVKLLTAATLWAGPSGTPAFLMLTALLGGALALLLLIPPGAYVMTVVRAKLGSGFELPSDSPSTPVPYGIAIAAAAVLVICLPHSG